MAVGYTAAVAAHAATLAACGSALYHAPRGRRGLLAAAALAANCALPLLFDRQTAYVSRCISAFLFFWLTNFKLLAWLAGRGPLAAQPWSWAQWVALYALPIIPAAPAGPGKAGSGRTGCSGRASDSAASGPAAMFGRWLLKTGLAAAVVFGLQLDPPAFVRDLLYAFGMYGMLGCIMDGPASTALGLLGLGLEPHFRPPWQSESIARFWGAQWNQAASNSLRTAVYEPIMDGRLAAGPAQRAQQAGQPRRQGVPPSVARAALALCCACFVSGVVHEAIIVYVYHRTTGGAWLAFFSVQGPLILLERWALSALGSAGIKLPRPVRIAYTLCVMLLLGHYGFFEPAERIGMASDFAAAMRRAFAGLVGARAG